VLVSAGPCGSMRVGAGCRVWRGHWSVRVGVKGVDKSQQSGKKILLIFAHLINETPED
jgi:hypothetical protein